MYMLKYILKRIGLMIVTFTIIFVMCFVLIKLLPITINVTIGQDREILEAQLEARGYFKPIPELVIIQSLRHVQLFVTLWTAACQASLSFNHLPELAQTHVH